MRRHDTTSLLKVLNHGVKRTDKISLQKETEHKMWTVRKVHERKPAELNEVDWKVRSQVIHQSGSRLENHTASSGIHWRFRHEDLHKDRTNVKGRTRGRGLLKQHLLISVKLGLVSSDKNYILHRHTISSFDFNPYVVAQAELHTSRKDILEHLQDSDTEFPSPIPHLNSDQNIKHFHFYLLKKLYST